MKLILESTEQLVHFNNTKCRIWKGKTEGGVDVVCLIAAIGVPEGTDGSELQRMLTALPGLQIDESTGHIVEASNG